MKQQKTKNKHKRVLFVCTGNTCRSPMAEALLRDKLKKNKIRWWDVSSCGIHADVGGAISAESKTVLQEIAISVENFVPRQLTQKIIDKSALIVCMTESQKKLLEPCGKVICIKDICGNDVPDPYGCGIETYRRTRDELSRACDILIEKYITNKEGI